MADIPKSDLLFDMAKSFSMDPLEFFNAVKMQCFTDGVASNAQMLMLLSVAKKYDLNPLVRELHAFVGKNGKMQVVVGLDGWFKIAARDARYAGRQLTKNYNDKGELHSITCLTYRHDWKVPDEYEAVMAEWFQEHKPGKSPTNWEEMPEHRLQGVTIKEGIRRTMGITEAIGPEDERKMRESEEREAAVVVNEPIRQPAPPPQAAIEHNPPEVANFVKVNQPEPVPVAARGHLRVVLNPEVAKVQEPPHEVKSNLVESDLAGQNQPDGASANAQSNTAPSGAPPELGPCQFKGCAVPATQPVTVKGQTWNLCDAHKEQVAPTPKRRGRPAGSINKPKDEPTPADAQAAAGLETIDPTERPLETFCRAHEMTGWLKVQLDKRGLDNVKELSAADHDKLLNVLKLSMGIKETL